jgi:hypothetical protein
LQYSNVGGGPKSVVATTSATRAEEMPPLILEGESALYDALIVKRHLNPKPVRQVVGNVSGDALKESVAIYERYLTIVGPGFRGGQQFYFHDLAVDEGGDVTRLDLVDFTGDGRDEIVLQKTLSVEGGERDILQVWTVKSKDEPALIFQHEVGAQAKSGRVSNRVKIKAGRSPEIIIERDKADEELDPTEIGLPAADTHPALMPWDGVKSRTYGWEKGEFVVKGEKEGKARPKKGGASSPRPGAAPRGPAHDVPPPPRPPSADELQDQVYAMYRKERGVGKSKPRFDFVTDVAADKQNERVLIHGKDVVAFGKGFKGGTSYVYLSVGVEEPNDILGVTALDLTADGKAEVIVRAVIRAKASKNLGGKVITRHAVFVYGITEGGVYRIFAAETGRSLDGNAILGQIAFVPADKGYEIQLRPGAAVGWTQDNYPFPPDRFPYGGLEPLLLPWTDMNNRVYFYDGDKFGMR